ncbi:hypothetical protein DPEC_G00024360 [Dallia pectoralis]|uniref:Uncharacterized protein n=1 Tax=Dallia pectoralis TaxID=75939 RepID=A0ACC2HGW2_DALPE|nr:hypothetical protein DPEC_G00024360 [Dallia pectoralis]
MSLMTARPWWRCQPEGTASPRTGASCAMALDILPTCVDMCHSDRCQNASRPSPLTPADTKFPRARGEQHSHPRCYLSRGVMVNWQTHWPILSALASMSGLC